jgi:opacity protein-like surface antigen
MRRVAFIGLLFAAAVIAAAPVAAQTPENRWMLNAQIGPSFGTFGTTPTFDASAGFTFTPKLAVVGELGGLSHAPFEKAAAIAPAVTVPGPLADSSTHVNGYHYNANLLVTPGVWGRVTPYATGGVGAFTGSTVVKYDVGSARQRTYRSDTNFATNVGGGVSYRLNRWFGINADYRHFFVDADALQHVNRFTTGVSLFIK